MTKYFLTQIIKALSEEEDRYVRQQIKNRKTRGENNNVLKLYDCIRKKQFDEYDNNLMLHILSKEDKNAFYKLKHDLQQNIERHILIYASQSDDEYKIWADINLAFFFEKKHLYGKAVQYLEKALDLSQKSEKFVIQQYIYNRMIVLSQKYDILDSNELIKKRDDNKKQYDLSIKIDDLLAKAGQHSTMNKKKSKGDAPEIADNLNEVIEELKANSRLTEEPSLQLKINQAIRNNLFLQNRLGELEEYLLESYQQFKEEGFFNKHNQFDKNLFLTSTINVLHRNRKYEESKPFVKELGQEILRFKKKYYQQFLWTYEQSLLFNDFYLNDLDNATNRAKDLCKAELVGIPFYDFFIYILLCRFYYCQSKIEKSIDQISVLKTKNRFDTLREIWQLQILMTEIVLRIETQDFKYANNSLTALKRKYAKAFRDGKFSSDKHFVKLLQQYLKNPTDTRNPKLKKMIKEFTDTPNQTAKILDYKIWVATFWSKKDYYKAVLKESKQSRANSSKSK